MKIAVLFVLMISALRAEDVYEQAKVAFEQGRFDNTLQLLGDLTNRGPGSPALYNLQALAFAGLGRYDNALAAIRRACQLDPNNPNYIYNTGLIIVDKGQFEPAEQVFRQGLKRFPRSDVMYQGLGEALIKQNRFKEAEESLHQAQIISPESGAVYVALARLYYLVGDGDNLGTAARKAAELQPANYLACFYYGTWLADYQHQTAAGSAFIRKSIELQPRFVDGLKAWGRLVSHEGRWTEAVRAYEQALAVDTHDPQLLYVLSVAYREIGDKQKAESALAEYTSLAH